MTSPLENLTTNSVESRFDLAYNAAHALCLAALRHSAYRAANRYIVFQVRPHTLGLGPEVWRVLAHSHGLHNRAEYEAILAGLTEAKRRGGRRVRVISDSELAVRQLTGSYQVKDEALRELNAKVSEVAEEFEWVEFWHRPREHPWIARADEFANQALDEEARRATP